MSLSNHDETTRKKLLHTTKLPKVSMQLLEKKKQI